MSRSQASEASNMKRNIRPLAVSVIVGLAVCVVVLLVMSLVVSALSVPQSFISPMAIFSISVGGFASGVCSARLLRERGLLYGAVCGAVISVAMMLASFAVSDSGLGLLALIKMLFIMLSAMLGGVLGVNKKPRRR